MTIETRSEAIEFSRASGAGTYVFPLSSETPYRRLRGMEILVHSEESVDLSLLNSGSAPLLDHHDASGGLDKQIGVVKRAWLQDRRVYVEVKFSNRSRAQEIKADVEDGIIRNVSVGYRVQETEPTRDGDSYRVTKWTPIEASFVTIPADPTVGMGRSSNHRMEVRMPDDQQPSLPGYETEDQRAERMEAAISEIGQLAATKNMSRMANSFVEGQVRLGLVPSVPVFKAMLRAEIPQDEPLVNQDIGLSVKERRQFSIRKLVMTMVDPGERTRQDAAFELEAVEASSVHARSGKIALPAEVMQHWNDYEVDGVRAPVSVGGNPNVQDTDHLASRFIDNLRNRMVLGRLGLTMLSGLEGDIEIPGGENNTVAAWVGSEDADVAESVPTFRKIGLAIHDLGVFTDLTRRMLIQSTIDIERYVRNQIITAMAQEIDRVGFYGTGLAGQPTGIINTTGIGSVTFLGAIPTRNELIDMRALISASNQVESPVFVTNTTVEADLMKTLVDAGSGQFLVDGVSRRLHIGNTMEATNQFLANDILAGVFSDAVMGMWGTLELDRSVEAKFLSAGVRLRAIQSVDFAVRRVGSFAYGT